MNQNETPGFFDIYNISYIHVEVLLYIVLIIFYMISFSNKNQDYYFFFNLFFLVMLKNANRKNQVAFV